MLKKKFGQIALLVFAGIFCFNFTFAQAAGKTPNKKEKQVKLTEFQRQARSYRQQGIQKQANGDAEGALALYEKAVVLDPSYVVVYNDIGIILEAKAEPGSAERAYLNAIVVDPNYPDSYSNLALLYESAGSPDKAWPYWQKRAQLGQVDDPWTLRARQKIAPVISETTQPVVVTPQPDVETIKPAQEQPAVTPAEQPAVTPAEQPAVTPAEITPAATPETTTPPEESREIKEARIHISLAEEMYNKGYYNQAQEELNLILAVIPQDPQALKLMDMVKEKLKQEEEKEKAQLQSQEIKKEDKKVPEEINSETTKLREQDTQEDALKLPASPQK